MKFKLFILVFMSFFIACQKNTDSNEPIIDPTKLPLGSLSMELESTEISFSTAIAKTGTIGELQTVTIRGSLGSPNDYSLLINIVYREKEGINGRTFSHVSNCSFIEEICATIVLSNSASGQQNSHQLNLGNQTGIFNLTIVEFDETDRIIAATFEGELIPTINQVERAQLEKGQFHLELE